MAHPNECPHTGDFCDDGACNLGCAYYNGPIPPRKPKPEFQELPPGWSRDNIGPGPIDGGD